ncbi:olfactory receptor 151-like isoform X2 [Crotalus tigris]|uniref:olfactory receptor 151-like isoform X2 n=1 Tax=Crotalus tigris TaxID=88082 RepID=UPI00192F5A23|nr:olfactory receptor 151-like isoform X2 [Crotalus tigris]
MMFEENTTTVVKDFIFVGLTSSPKMQIILFLIFFLIYVTTLIENLGIVALIGTSACLHTPMYFFLSSLSILDACFSSVFAPKMLVNFLADKNSISYTECAIQMYFFIGLGSAECFLLAAMAYDRYVAICKPLLYPVLMSPKAQGQEIMGSCLAIACRLIYHFTVLYSLLCVVYRVSILLPTIWAPHFTDLQRMEGCVNLEPVRIKLLAVGKVNLQYYVLTTVPPSL